MDDKKQQPSSHQSKGRLDLDDSQDDSRDLPSGQNHVNGSSSPASDGPEGFPVAVDKPKIGQEASAQLSRSPEEEIIEQQPHDASIGNTAYNCPRVRISREVEQSPNEFSGDEIDPATPRTPGGADRGFVDTGSPVGFVKDAVSRFGGIAHWKTRKSRTFEKRKTIDHELEKAQQEIPLIKQQTEAAEEARTQVLKDLEATNRLIEELQLNLERAQTEENQAKQDFQLAKQRVKEMEQEIADEDSAAAKEQLEAARARHVAAVSELKCVKDELSSLEKEYSSLLYEKEVAIKRAEEAVSASKEVEQTVEELNIELTSTKEFLESAQTANLEAEQRTGASMASEQDILVRDKELKQAEEKIEKLNQQIQAEKDLKGKLDTASALLARLKSELAAYMESNLEQVATGNLNTEKKNHNEMQAAAVAAKNELEEMKLNTEKARDELKCLKVAALSLSTELEHGTSELTSIKQKEGMALVAVASLQNELERIKAEIAAVQVREKDATDKMMELPKQLQLASQEAEQAKSAAEAAREALRKAEEEAEQAKARATTVETQLLAAQKEIEVARDSEKLAMATIRALQESESTQSNDCGDRTDCVTLPVEEYYELSKRAHEAEEQANTKVAAAMAEIEAAKEAEVQMLNKLEEANWELATRREVYTAATDKAEKANEAKLGVEQELTQWKTENEQQQKEKITSVPASHEQGQGLKSPKQVGNAALSQVATSSKELRKSDLRSPRLLGRSITMDSSPEVKGGKKKKKSFLPRMLMLFSKKKTSSRTS